jgi:cell division protein FtsQ
MKRESILARQSVKRRSQKDTSVFWRVIRVVFSLSFKVSLLAIGVISLSLVFLSLYEYLVSSPYLKLEQVIVRGVDEDMKREMIDMSELDVESSLLSINPDKIKEKIERHPWVRAVKLEKRFPHTLVINAEKELPVAVVVLDGLSYMNSRGEVFKEVEQADDKDYPLITGISTNGAIGDAQLEMAAFVLDILKSETGAWSYEELSEIHVNEDCDVSIFSTSLPAVIKMGNRELLTKKDQLDKITRHLSETGRIHMVKSIDLNYRKGAVVSFNNES